MNIEKKIKLVVEPFKSESELMRQVEKKGGRVFLRHYFVIGNNYFPDRNWTDLSAAILDMWLENLRDLNTENNLLYFMDGNYALKLEELNDSEYLIRFGACDEEEFVESLQFEPIIVEMDLFKNEIINAANSIVDLLRELKVDSDDYYFKRLTEKLK